MEWGVLTRTYQTDITHTKPNMYTKHTARLTDDVNHSQTCTHYEEGVHWGGRENSLNTYWTDTTHPIRLTVDVNHT